jgi:leader peptidase (prepilin peptidase)/N-methyltransferase
MLHLTPALTAYVLFLTLVLGLCFGSFLNCLAWRLVHGEQIWRGHSHCALCNHPLSAFDLAPVVSFLCLKGRCRYCGQKISPRYPASELLCGALFLSIVLRYDVTAQAAQFLLLGCVLFVAALTDLDSLEIPDRLHVAAIVFWLAFLPLSPAPVQALKQGLLGAFSVAGALLLVVLLADKVMGRETMGGADIKLLFVTGLYFGWAGNLLELLLACALGLLFAAVMGAKGREFPFGPSIAGAAWLVMLFGQRVLDWYLAFL